MCLFVGTTIAIVYNNVRFEYRHIFWHGEAITQNTFKFSVTEFQMNIMTERV